MRGPPRRWAIYGATGVCGRQIARRARQRGHRPLLLGRDPDRLAAVAGPLGLPWSVVPLSERGLLVTTLQEVDLLLNAAGPFGDTWSPLVEACLAAGTHYLDLSSEFAVAEAIHRLHRRASRRGVVLLPGAGYLAVATDCLANYGLRQLPSASRLLLGLSRTPSSSAGTTRTVLANASGATRIRRDGLWLQSPLGFELRVFDFGCGPTGTIALPFGDLISIAESTGLAHLEICGEISALEWQALRWSRPFLRPDASRWLGRAWLAHRQLAAALRRPPDGSSADPHHQALVVLAADPEGRQVLVRLWVRDSYRFTTDAALALIEALGIDSPTRRETAAPAGFLAPSRILPVETLLRFRGVVLQNPSSSAHGNSCRPQEGKEIA